MAGIPDRLAPLRSVFSNPDRTSGETCRTCTTPALSAGYSNCYQCDAQARSGHLLSDVVAPISYAVEGLQAMRDLYNYKSGSESVATRVAARDRLLSVLYLSLDAHLGCFGGIDGIATVPSSGSRDGLHPVEQMRSLFGDGFTQLPISYAGPMGLDRAERRILDPARFEVAPRLTAGRRVLLLDDAWVSGVHMQSAAAALKMAGASHVAAVPIGRVISPRYSESKTYLANHSLTPSTPQSVRSLA